MSQLKRCSNSRESWSQSTSRIAALRLSVTLARLRGLFDAELTLIHVDEFLLIYPHTGPLGFTHFWESIRSEHVAARQKELNELAPMS